MRENYLAQIQDEFLFSVLNGKLYEYESYNHKAALYEFQNNPKYEQQRRWVGEPNSWGMPLELKHAFREMKIGKLRSIDFDPEGNIRKIKIGNKRAKSFRLKDFNVRFKPIT